MMTYWIIYCIIWDKWIKSALLLTKNLIAILPVIKKIKTKIKAYGDEATNLHDKQIPKASSNYTCLAVMNIYSALKKHGNYNL